MNIETITSPKTYSRSYLHVCPSDEAGLLRYSSSPSTSRFTAKSPVKPPSPSMMHASSSSQKSHQESCSSDLQSVVSKYHADPELLKLILASKVEEDKRRTEEAKLKAKEIDLYFQQQQEKEETNTNRKSLLYPKESQQAERRRRSSCSSTSSNGSTTNTIGAVDSIHRRIAPYSIPRPIAINDGNIRRNSSVSTALASINKLSINNNQQKIAMASSAPSSSAQYLYSQAR